MRYEYRCANGHVFDVEKGIDDPHPTECPQCGAPARRIFSPLNVIYRCSGFKTADKALDRPVPGYDGPDEYEMAYGR